MGRRKKMLIPGMMGCVCYLAVLAVGLAVINNGQKAGREVQA